MAFCCGGARQTTAQGTRRGRGEGGVSMARRVLSLWLPRLATDRLARREPVLREAPLVTVVGERGRMIVAATNASAESAGIQPGMTLADARALEPTVKPADADFVGDARGFDGGGRWWGGYKPLGGGGGPGGIFFGFIR